MTDAKPWDLLDPRVPRVSDEIQKERMDICIACPELIQTTKQCKKCLCIMPLKTTLEKAKCPLSKW